MSGAGEGDVKKRNDPERDLNSFHLFIYSSRALPQTKERQVALFTANYTKPVLRVFINILSLKPHKACYPHFTNAEAEYYRC